MKKIMIYLRFRNRGSIQLCEMQRLKLLDIVCPDRLRKSGGGVCVYVKSTLKYTVLKDLTEISDFGFHQLWIQIQHAQET